MTRKIILPAVLAFAFVAACVAIRHQAVAQGPGPVPGRPGSNGFYGVQSNNRSPNQFQEWLGTSPELQADVEHYISAKDDDAKQAARTKIMAGLRQRFDDQHKQRE